MGTRDDYPFARLEEPMIAEIRELEQRLSEQNGEPVTLVAYARQSESTTDCRAGLNE